MRRFREGSKGPFTILLKQIVYNTVFAGRKMRIFHDKTSKTEAEPGFEDILSRLIGDQDNRLDSPS
jgi:hypothetical protein